MCTPAAFNPPTIRDVLLQNQFDLTQAQSLECFRTYDQKGLGAALNQAHFIQNINEAESAAAGAFCD